MVKRPTEEDTTPTKKEVEIATKIVKLNRYIAQFSTRSWNVEEALGKPGQRIMNDLLDDAVEILKKQGVDIDVLLRN